MKQADQMFYEAHNKRWYLQKVIRLQQVKFVVCHT